MRRRTALPPRARIASRASLAETVARPSSGAARSSKKERSARISGTAEPWSAGPSPVCQYTMLPAPSRHARSPAAEAPSVAPPVESEAWRVTGGVPTGDMDPGRAMMATLGWHRSKATVRGRSDGSCLRWGGMRELIIVNY